MSNTDLPNHSAEKPSLDQHERASRKAAWQLAQAARTAAKAGEWSAAISEWDQALATQPGEAPLNWLLARARALMQAGQPAEAEASLALLIRSNRDDGRGYLAWAELAMREHDWGAALHRLEQSRKSLPDHIVPERHLRAATSLLYQGRASEVGSALRRFTGLADDVSEVEIALEVSTRLTSLEFGGELRRKFGTDEEEYGRLAAVQHLRNVLTACSFNQAPPAFEEIIENSGLAGSAHLLRVSVPLLEAALVACLSKTGLPPWNVSRSAHKCLILAADMPKHSTGPHMRFTCAVAVALAMRDATWAVQVLITQELGPEGPRVSDGAIGPERLSEWREEVALLGGAVCANKISFVTPDKTGPVWPYHDSLMLAVAFTPDVIIAIQGIYESHVLPPLLYARSPLVAIQTNVDNPEPELCDLVLGHGRAAGFAHKPNAAKWRNYRLPVLPFPKTSHVEEAAVSPPSNFRIASALGHGRIEKALLARGGELLRRVIQFLNDHPGAVWVMMGVEIPERVREFIARSGQTEPLERLRLLPWVSDVRAIYEHCHAYVHLPGDPGGGMAIAMAVAEDLPILALNNTDAANFLPPTTLAASVDAVFEKLALCATRSEYRNRIAERQRAHMETANSFERASEVLDRLLLVAAEKFAIRQ